MDERIIQWQEYGQTVLHPVAAALILVCGFLLFILPRRHAVLLIMVSSLFLTEVQRIVIAGLDFNVMRIMSVLAWTRILLRGEVRRLRFTGVDKFMAAWTVSDIVFHTILIGTGGAFLNRLGNALEAMVLYLAFRMLLRDFSDVRRAVKGLVFLSLPIACAMLIEQFTGRNFFSVFGGVPEFTVERAGRLRAQAAFMHAILAGTFGAALVPLCAGLFRRGGSRVLGALGFGAGILIAFSSASSGPIMACAAGIGALGLWPFRRHMRFFLWSLVFTLVGLHLSMKAPVWALLNRVAVIGSSTAYHRYILLDNFIRRFGEWWFCGSTGAAHWGWGLQDITNQYVLVGLNGGVLTLVFFVLMIASAFRAVGFAAKAERKRGAGAEFLCWALGCALFVHVISFFGVSYFDQINLVWYLLLALISTAYCDAARMRKRKEAEKKRKRERPESEHLTEQAEPIPAQGG